MAQVADGPGRVSGQAGFSLLETLISLGVLATGALGLAAVFAQGVRTASTSPNELVAIQKASEAVESVFAARDSHTITWAQLRNRAHGGIFLDGLSFYQTGFGTFLMDPFLLERIEVVKGPSSALYGGGNPGGFINYVSKRPGEHYRTVETGINSFGNGYIAADLGDKLSDVLSYRVNGKLSGGGWETDQADDLRGAISSDRPDMLAMACVAAHIDRSVFKTILTRVRELNGGRPGGNAEADLRACSAFQELNPKDAVIAFSRMMMVLAPA